MDVTSMLSRGYLQPTLRAESRGADAVTHSPSLAMQEQQVLAEERALKATSNEVSTTYHYTVGPDGRRYITGAEVVVRNGEEKPGNVSGGVERRELIPRSGRTSGADAESAGKKPESEAANSDAVRELKQIEHEVIAHEAAHQAAGGRFAGPVSYTYTQGPDGKYYVTGGEVPIRVPAGDDPEQTLRDMEQVRRAALAPGSPSAQDMRVAAQAAMAAAQARGEIASLSGKTDGEQGPFKAGVASIQADIRSGQIRSGESELDTRAAEPDDPETAYAQTASQYGLWALGRGFEPGTSRYEPDDGLNIAA